MYQSSSAGPVTTMHSEPSEASTLPHTSSLEPSMFVLSESASFFHKRLASLACSSQSSANRNPWWFKGCTATHVIAVNSSIKASPRRVICFQSQPRLSLTHMWHQLIPSIRGQSMFDTLVSSFGIKFALRARQNIEIFPRTNTTASNQDWPGWHPMAVLHGGCIFNQIRWIKLKLKEGGS